MSGLIHLIKETIKGIVIGVANIIPGVSGGTMAVSMGVYDKLIGSLTELRSNFRKSVVFLLPYILGAVLGIAALSFVVRYTLANWPLQTAGLFTGLILGGLPVILRNFKGQRLNIAHGMIFAVFFILVIVMSLAKDVESTGNDFVISPVMILKLFLVGMIAAATMIIPGVSGSLVLMILGFYNGIISNISHFIESLLTLDSNGIIHGFGVFLPLGAGIIVGIVIIAKLIKWLFTNAPVSTYSAIVGLIIASPFAIFIETGIMAIDVNSVLFSVLLLAAGLIISFLMAREPA